TSLPLTLALTALAPFAGRLTDRLGGKYVLMAGLVVFAAGIAGVAVVSSTHATSLTFAPVLVVAGLGMGAIFAPLATEAPRGTPAQLLPELRHLIRDVFTHGYITAIRPTLAISVALLLAGAASCLLLRRHAGTGAGGPAAAAVPPAGATTATPPAGAARQP